METTTPAPPKKDRFAGWKAFTFAIAENPVILKELRKRMRGRQAYLLLFGYLVIISVFMSIIYATILINNSSSFRWDPEARQTLGKTIFGTIVLTELLLITLIAPSLTSGAIASEREHQTLDLLRTTLLSPRALVLGKLGSAFSFVVLLIFSAVPLQSLAFLFGGVGLAELIISSLLMIVTAFFFCALGLFFSSFLKRASVANTATYTVMVLATITLGVVFFILAAFSSGSNSIPEEIVALLLWFFISTNPILAAAVSETLLIDSQTLFLTSGSPFNSLPFPVPSPWIPFLIIYSLSALVMVIMSIQFVKHPDR
jgi:ABC-type transport system involved in multi-copper enzyme maturation permease subunit